MSRYIDADKLARTYMLKGKDKLRLATVINELELAPAEDVVEVVRCKDCKHYRTDEDGWCIYHEDCYLKPDDYCSYGERREK